MTGIQEDWKSKQGGGSTEGQDRTAAPMLEAEGIPPASPDRSASLPVLRSEVKGCKFHPRREMIDWMRLTVL